MNEKIFAWQKSSDLDLYSRASRACHNVTLAVQINFLLLSKEAEN